MPTEANPHHFSNHTKDDTTISQIEDEVDFPHTGLIKALSLGMKGNYVIKDSVTGFDITQSSSSSSAVVVESGKIFRDGFLTAATAQTTFAQSDFNNTINAHHLLVVDFTNTVRIRKFGTGGIYGGASNVANKIPPYTEGDTIIAIITHTSDGFNDMKVQYLTTGKTANSLSIGYPSGSAPNQVYDQTLSITGGSGKTTLLSEENQVVVKLNGTSSSNNFTVVDSADQTQFAVKGDGTLETDLTASRALVTDSSKNITASSVTSTELALLSGAAFGIGNNNILRANANVVDNDFLRVDGTQIEGRSASELAADIGALTGTFGIANNNILQANANLADDDFLRVDGTQIEGRTAAETLSDIAAMPLAGGTFTGAVTVDAGQTFRTPRLPTVGVTASTTLTEATHAGAYLLCAGNVTLPATSSQGEHYTILNTTTGNITVARNGNNINNAASDITVATHNGVTCIAVGQNHWIALGV